jgi:hypothetical protein
MTERCEDPAMRRERSSQLPDASAGVNQLGDLVLDIATMTAEHARIEVLECRLDVFESLAGTDDDGLKESREKGQESRAPSWPAPVASSRNSSMRALTASWRVTTQFLPT